ncbi:hypothetical protein BOH66_16165 [Microbacterium aurum]|uniref:Uncharacterized protein n=1 Tax=Microbacterium aurum TaxID=36805 RepID=A0A1P8UBT2_9MICO|nr:hypothetical protein BOH66_16165 [Microbacterium aurum]
MVGDLVALVGCEIREATHCPQLIETKHPRRAVEKVTINGEMIKRLKELLARAALTTLNCI